MAAVVKQTYDVGRNGHCTRADEQDGLITADQFYDNKDPVIASCLMESDFIPFKVATDVVVIGKAHSPGGRPVRFLEVSVSVGQVTKRIKVLGNRTCAWLPDGRVLFSEPEPFTEMEIRYERAYGGVDLVSFGADAPMMYPRNHLGKGFVVRNTRQAVEGLDLPNLEDPSHLLTPGNLITGQMEGWQKQPMPQGFGWFGKLWYPRCSFAGVLPAYMSLYEQIQEAVLGIVPRDQVEQFKKFKMPMLDFKFFSGASPGLALPFLQGDETIRLVNLDPSAVVELKLPGSRPKIGIDLGEGCEFPDVVLQTVCILKEQNRMYQVWRGAIGYPGPEKFEAIKRMDVLVEEE
jgi:hypothetical protein